MFWRSVLLLTLAAGRLAMGSVTYSFSENYFYADPKDPNLSDQIRLYADFTLVVPDFLNGFNTFSADQTQSCFGGGLADGTVYGFNCSEIFLDISGDEASVRLIGCLTSSPSSCSTFADESFVIVPNQSGTWYAFNRSEFPSDTVGGSSLAVNPEPGTFGLMLPALLLSFLFGARRR